MEQLTCTKCDKVKDLTEEFWYKSKLTKSGFRGACRKCTADTDKQWRADNVKRCKETSHAKRLKNSYGITPEEYSIAMATSTICEICGSEEVKGSASKKLNYDHCHTDGHFRGVLCRTCNQAIGQLGDTSASLLKAYKYLKTSEDKIKEQS